MKKVNFLTLTILTSMALSTAPISMVSADNVTADSTTSASFKENEKPDNPVDPVNPDNPVDPEPVNPVGKALSLDFASAFIFGETTIDAKEMVVNVEDQQYKDGGTAGTGELFAQVTDKRAGEAKGWQLTVVGSKLTDENENTLEGAKISLSQAEVKTATTNTTKDKAATGDAAFDIDLNGSASQNVMIAAEGNGFGTWVDNFNKGDKIQLKVPMSAHPNANEYSGKLTWTLTDGPSA